MTLDEMIRIAEESPQNALAIQSDRQTIGTADERKPRFLAQCVFDQSYAAFLVAWSPVAVLREITALRAVLAARERDQTAIAEKLCLTRDDAYWWTQNDEGEVECDSFAEAVLKTFQFSQNDINRLEALQLELRQQLRAQVQAARRSALEEAIEAMRHMPAGTYLMNVLERLRYEPPTPTVKP